MAAGAASAQTVGDHKALVCIFLAGGNDQSNTVVPRSGGGYNSYQQGRPSLALPAANLLAINPTGYSGDPLGLHPSLSAIQPLFNQQRVALMANVGTLAVPITRAQWNSARPTVPVPIQLFSHSDQQGAWQTGLPDRSSQTGWQGRMGDLLASSYNPGSGVSIAMSVAGNNLMQAGSSTIQYQLTTDGAVRVDALSGLYGSAAGGTAARQLMTNARAQLLENELVTISRRAIDSEAVVRGALSGVTAGATFPQTGLGRQLQMVARMIAARSALGQRRQMFFVQQGGYDFHDNLLSDQGDKLRELGDAMAAFYQATATLGVANQVTTFTASDFGRAQQHNGRGSDHGWGAHHFVMGGAVQGNRVYGQFPTVALNGPQDAGRGALIPTTSVDEYAATLSRWFGVSSSNLPLVLPNIGRFASRDLGFMGPLA
ncbi:DUF1501 domain-containing protein [Hydrogenophaga sp.]|uniref:DUF1501 domain-containing protein n=1 Tax=Hydrogenophaga sp. TaxID=1904254 RepID=UPI0026130A02|nr:DUF1501 domain-containing protein [Hydrogenophaga sp.]MDM7950756.1 DUF1501 domain-containing protein [Hydrogenophaga sp.]